MPIRGRISRRRSISVEASRVAPVPVFSLDTNSELRVAAALLEVHEIVCSVHNDGFGGRYPGVQLHIHNVRRIYVPAEQVEEAVELLGDFARPSDAPRSWRSFG